MNTIQSCWEQYLFRVIPTDACKSQIADTKVAFYSGAIAYFSMIESICDLLDGGTSDEGGALMLKTLKDELLAYMHAYEQEAENAKQAQN